MHASLATCLCKQHARRLRAAAVGVTVKRTNFGTGIGLRLRAVLLMNNQAPKCITGGGEGGVHTTFELYCTATAWVCRQVPCSRAGISRVITYCVMRFQVIRRHLIEPGTVAELEGTVYDAILSGLAG